MKRLKIVEQIIIVLFLAVVIPFVTIGLIISNISQQSVRGELTNSTTLIAEFVADAIQNYVKLSQSQLDQLASGFNYIPDAMAKIQYFDDIESKTKIFKNLDIIEKQDLPKKKYEINGTKITLVSPIDKQKTYFLKAQVDANIIDELLKEESIRGRKIYIFDEDRNLVAKSLKADNNTNILEELNVSNEEKIKIFGKDKNTPKAYYKIDNPDWFVVVDTTGKVTKKTITKAKHRIILSLVIAVFSIFVIAGFYIYYLYINIRQLFKGITAISKGNYDKKIHLIKSAFTPYETVFLAREFNYMANKIKVSYEDLTKQNFKLQQLNEFRENLVNSTSHEFRTPLTSIIGYTSRLLRHDIKVDDETKIKSLQIIKQQAQRLSKMVEDLLVIPELESYSLKFNMQEVDLAEVINRTLEYFKSNNVELVSDVASDMNYIWIDEYRLEQIIVNLVDNAIKYSKDDAPVEIIANNDENNVPTLIIMNKCEKISDDMKEKLFDKFIRVDSNLTRKTRGTGLGLYIVKGLCNAMKIDITLDCSEDFILTLKFNDYIC